MKRQTLTRIHTRNGVELWRSLVDGVEQFAVRFSQGRVRTLSSLEAAQTLFSYHVRLGEHARAH